MNIHYKFMSSKRFLINNRYLSLAFFMVIVLICSFALSYFMVSSSQKNESQKISELTSKVEQLNEEIRQKDLLITELKEKLKTVK